MVETREELWQRQRGLVRAAFVKVLQEAVPPSEIWETGWHSRREMGALQKQLKRLEYEPQLPIGGEEERRIAAKLSRLIEKVEQDRSRLPLNLLRSLRVLRRKYRSLDGRYYILKPLREKTQDLWEMQLARSAEEDDVELKRACELAAKGAPEAKSDFYLEPLYVLQRVDGNRNRMVRVINVHGAASEILPLPSDFFASPLEFRKWLLNASNSASWHGGQNELTGLQEDIGASLWDRLAVEVPIRGYHEESKIWFFDDVAYAPGDLDKHGKPGKAHLLFQDHHGLFWWKGKGYRLTEKDQEGQAFVQSTPKMHPQERVTDEQVRDFFRELSHKLMDALGGYSAFLVLGAMASYAWGPELYAEHAGFPGLWVHGDPQQGKSSISRWGRWMWGYEGVKSMKGIPLLNSTRAGMSIALQQYSYLPVWFEEFQAHPERWLVEMIKGIFGRESGIKKTFDEVAREIRAGVIITGVGTCDDAQVRSRFAHVIVSKSNRRADHYKWLQTESRPKYRWIGRYLMENRAEFARLASGQMRHWMESDLLQECESRVRLVHASAYASFAALAAMLGSHDAEELRAFKQFILEHTLEADKEAREQVYLNDFWMTLLAAIKAGEFGETAAELGRYLKILAAWNAPCPVSEAQRLRGEQDPFCRWESLFLFLTMDVVDRVCAYKRKLGETMKVTLSDLRAQLRTRPYWRAPKGDSHRQRFVGSANGQGCWCIALDQHELGLVQVPDGVFEESFLKPDGSYWPKEEWVDPRKGELFYIVDRLKPRQAELSAK
jgi:hypothetical protein